MWHLRFFGTILAVLTLQGLMGSQTALAVDPVLSKLSMGQPQVMRGLDGSFQLAVMGNNVVPMDIPPEKSPEKAQPEKPVVKKNLTVKERYLQMRELNPALTSLQKRFTLMPDE